MIYFVYLKFASNRRFANVLSLVSSTASVDPVSSLLPWSNLARDGVEIGKDLFEEWHPVFLPSAPFLV